MIVKSSLTILGALMILFGIFLALQGADLIHWPLESTMLGRGVWIRNGLIIAAFGAILVTVARRR
jgi:uncharacterized membrane protein